MIKFLKKMKNYQNSSLKNNLNQTTIQMDIIKTMMMRNTGLSNFNQSHYHNIADILFK
jgi:hypothetical protein